MANNCLSIVVGFLLLLTLLIGGRKCADVSLSADDYLSSEFSMDLNEMSLSGEGQLFAATNHIEDGCQLRCEDHVSVRA